MKDMKGTNIRAGSYILGEDCFNLHRVLYTTRKKAYEPKVVVAASIDPSAGCYGQQDWHMGENDLCSCLVIPRRLVVPKLKPDQIKLYAALAGLEVMEEEEDA